jgi:hypothetical protein
MDDTGDSALVGGEIQAGGVYLVVYNTALNGAVGGWLLINPAFPGQLKFKSGGNTSTDPNTLDSYTDWITYTPTFTGFGTATFIDVWSKRIGDTLYVQGRFRAGTTTATEARITLGFNGTDSNVTISATKVAALRVSGRVAGAFVSNTNPYQTLMLGGVGYITLAKADTTGSLTNVNGTAFSSGDIITFTAEVPISGW